MPRRRARPASRGSPRSRRCPGSRGWPCQDVMALRPLHVQRAVAPHLGVRARRQAAVPERTRLDVHEPGGLQLLGQELLDRTSRGVRARRRAPQPQAWASAAIAPSPDRRCRRRKRQARSRVRHAHAQHPARLQRAVALHGQPEAVAQGQVLEQVLVEDRARPCRPRRECPFLRSQHQIGRARPRGRCRPSPAWRGSPNRGAGAARDCRGASPGVAGSVGVSTAVATTRSRPTPTSDISRRGRLSGLGGAGASAAGSFKR